MAKSKKKEVNATEIKYAENLYVEKGFTPQFIADELERNIKTIYAWRDKYGWDETRSLFETSPTELKRVLLREAVRIARGEARKDAEGNDVKGIDADALSKVMKAYDYMCVSISPSVCRDVLVEFDNWLATKEPKLAADMTQFHKMFLIFKIQQENGGN